MTPGPTQQDRPQLPGGRNWAGFLQMSRECAAGQWRWPIPWFFVPRRLQNFRSQRCAAAAAGESRHTGHSLSIFIRPSLPASATGQWALKEFPECLPECAAPNKDHVGRIGLSHPLFACFALPCSLPI